MQRPSKLIFDTLQEERFNQKKCPSCGLPREQWTAFFIDSRWRNGVGVRHIIYYKDVLGVSCCSSQCGEKFKYLSWSELRGKIIIRDNFTCHACKLQGVRKLESGKWYRGKELVADHIVPIALGGLQWDENNLQTLCKACHKIKTKEDMIKIWSLKNGGKNKSSVSSL